MDNKTIILDRSLDLFSRYGYDAVGVQEIAQECGVTKPTIYYHFGSKRGLLDALLESNLSPLIRELAEDGLFRGDLIMNLRSSCFRLFWMTKEKPGLLRILFSSNFAPPESELQQAAAPWNRKISAIFEELFRDAVKSHGNMKGRESLHAASFLGTVYTYISLELSGGIQVDEALGRQLVSTFMHGIFS